MRGRALCSVLGVGVLTKGGSGDSGKKPPRCLFWSARSLGGAASARSAFPAEPDRALRAASAMCNCRPIGRWLPVLFVVTLVHAVSSMLSPMSPVVSDFESHDDEEFGEDAW